MQQDCTPAEWGKALTLPAPTLHAEMLELHTRVYLRIHGALSATSYDSDSGQICWNISYSGDHFVCKTSEAQEGLILCDLTCG